MILYISTILVASLLIFLYNTFIKTGLSDYTTPYILGVVVFAVLIEIFIDAIIAFVIHSLPNKYFSIEKRVFHVSYRERKFYDALRIKKWKDKVIELGFLGGFSKKKVENPNDKEYLHKFLLENNIGVAVHFSSIILGFGIMLLVPRIFRFSIGLPVAIVNLVLHMLPIMVLRYTTPRLLAGYNRMLRKEQINIALDKMTDEELVNNGN